MFVVMVINSNNRRTEVMYYRVRVVMSFYRASVDYAASNEVQTISVFCHCMEKSGFYVNLVQQQNRCWTKLI